MRVHRAEFMGSRPEVFKRLRHMPDDFDFLSAVYSPLSETAREVLLIHGQQNVLNLYHAYRSDEWNLGIDECRYHPDWGWLPGGN